jgi:LAO/AO transport system kinase
VRLDDPGEVAALLLAGNVSAGARAIRWLDDRDPRSRALLAAIYPRTGRAQVVGITGPPGAGKSSLVDALVSDLRARGLRIGVLAVDPSSPFTGGAILGDRVRMGRHALDPGVFIRSLGTRGQAGGLSRSTDEACLVLDAMGHDLVIIETVGVGQDEIDIVSLAHTTVIVMVPGLGDEVQAVKAGLLEAGDILVINKADREGAAATARQIGMMLHLRATAGGNAEQEVPLHEVVATQGKGIAALAEAILSHRAELERRAAFTTTNAVRARQQVLALVREELARRALALADPAILEAAEQRLIDPHKAAMQILAAIDPAAHEGG